MKTKRIPANALQFAAAIEVKSDKKSTDLKPVPVTLRARSADVVEHWFWGRTVHDFSGMTAAADRLPLDYQRHERGPVQVRRESQDAGVT